MKFPTYEEMGREVANRALDEFEYKGKTLRQWIEIILATDNNVGTKLSTNLASLGTDCSEFPNNSDTIYRQAAIEALDEQIEQCDKSLSSFGISMKDEYAVKVERASLVAFRETLEYLPPAQPKRGKWHYSDGKPARIGLSFGVVCDQCGTESEYCTNFCGECGADMRSDDMREVTT